MKIKVLYFLFSLVLFSCKKTKKTTEVSENTKSYKTDTTHTELEVKEKKELVNFFDFDKIEYYYREVSEREILKIKQKTNKTSNEEIFLDVTFENSSEDINREQFVEKLKKIGFKKEVIKNVEYDLINNIFSETKCDSDYAFACKPIYRDILVFYMKEEIIGLSKICFDCRQERIIGTDKDTDNFGQCGGYEELYKILRK